MGGEGGGGGKRLLESGEIEPMRMAVGGIFVYICMRYEPWMIRRIRFKSIVSLASYYAGYPTTHDDA